MSRRYRKPDAGLKHCDYALTLAEIGRELGISYERVRQLENRALSKARAILHKRGFTLQDFLDGERSG
jgi:DNA-directed RNA polymerase sigma subunit (sigma70/sigma32)